MSSGSLISRIGARARANENQWAKKEQEIDLQKRNKKRNKEGEDDEVVDDRKKLLLLEKKNDDDDDEGGNNINSKMEYDGVTKLAEVYANELRLSAQLFARSPFHKLLPVVRISVVAASFPARSVRVLFRWFRAVEFKRVVVCASRDGSAFVIASPFFRHIMIRNTPEILVLVLRRRRASHFSCGKSKGNARAQLFPYYSSFQLFSSHP